MLSPGAAGGGCEVVQWHRAATHGGGTFALAIALFCQHATANALPLYVAAWLCDDDDQCIAQWVGCLPHHHDAENEDHGNLQRQAWTRLARSDFISVTKLRPDGWTHDLMRPKSSDYLA